jgi:hypothetical protein
MNMDFVHAMRAARHLTRTQKLTEATTIQTARSAAPTKDVCFGSEADIRSFAA